MIECVCDMNGSRQATETQLLLPATKLFTIAHFTDPVSHLLQPRQRVMILYNLTKVCSNERNLQINEQLKHLEFPKL